MVGADNCLTGRQQQEKNPLMKVGLYWCKSVISWILMRAAEELVVLISPSYPQRMMVLEQRGLIALFLPKETYWDGAGALSLIVGHSPEVGR